MREPGLVGAILAVLILLIAVPGYTEGVPLSGTKICLDPGHGGSDPGAVYDDGTIYLEEADINLDVAYGLKALLEADEAAVVMTRYGDDSRSNNDRYTFCNEQGATILVSIHTNSVDNPDRDGSMALYFHSDDKVLAQAIYDIMYPDLRDSAPGPGNFTGFGLDRFASGVLLKSDMPAAMMEPVFMSNPAEAELLVIPIYSGSDVCDNCRRAQIAQAIRDGIVAYFGGSEPTPTPEPAGTMHVDAIDMNLEYKAVWTNATATITIDDDGGVPVEGATVYGKWGGATKDSDSGITDGDGRVVLESDAVKKASSGTIFTFEVTDVVLGEWTYDSAANGETSASIQVA